MICPSIKPPKISWNSGSSRRNASCPLSLLTSTKLTLALDVFKDLIIVFVSEVGNNQSDVKLMQKEQYLKELRWIPFWFFYQTSLFSMERIGKACLRVHRNISTRRFWRTIFLHILNNAWYARRADQEMVEGVQCSSSHAKNVSWPCHVATSKQRIWVIISRRRRKPWHARHASVYE
mgnify:CR=1 FL=1